jgi:hypothetical protein
MNLWLWSSKEWYCLNVCPLNILWQDPQRGIQPWLINFYYNNKIKNSITLRKFDESIIFYKRKHKTRIVKALKYIKSSKLVVIWEFVAMFKPIFIKIVRYFTITFLQQGYSSKSTWSLFFQLLKTFSFHDVNYFCGFQMTFGALAKRLKQCLHLMHQWKANKVYASRLIWWGKQCTCKLKGTKNLWILIVTLDLLTLEYTYTINTKSDVFFIFTRTTFIQ